MGTGFWAVIILIAVVATFIMRRRRGRGGVLASRHVIAKSHAFGRDGHIRTIGDGPLRPARVGIFPPERRADEDILPRKSHGRNDIFPPERRADEDILPRKSHGRNDIFPPMRRDDAEVIPIRSIPTLMVVADEWLKDGAKSNVPASAISGNDGGSANHDTDRSAKIEHDFSPTTANPDTNF